MNGISTFIKETLKSSMALLPHEDTARRQPSMNQEALTRHEICQCLGPGLTSHQGCEK